MQPNRISEEAYVREATNLCGDAFNSPREASDFNVVNMHLCALRTATILTYADPATLNRLTILLTVSNDFKTAQPSTGSYAERVTGNRGITPPIKKANARSHADDALPTIECKRLSS
jgi:hypothetical protein